MVSLPQSVGSFTVIPVAYSPSATHILYVRQHSGSKKDKGKKNAALPDGRTLFVVNVPPDATERELILFFNHCGTIERIVFDQDSAHPEDVIMDDCEGDLDEEKEQEDGREEEAMTNGDSDEGMYPRKKRKINKSEKAPAPKVIPLPVHPLRKMRRTGGSAHIVFLDSSSIPRALAVPSKPRPWQASPDEPAGLAHYQALHDSFRPPLDVIRAHADSWLERFDYDQAQKKQQSQYRKGEAIVDEDGFTLVTRGGAYGKTLGGGVGVATKRFMRGRGEVSGKRGKKKKKPREKETFYAFQRAEKQRKDLMNIKNKWEEDKAKVEKLKQSKQYKPY